MAGIIDGHQHCWQLSRPECQWPGPDEPAIHRDFSPADLEAVARPLGIAGSVLVQSQPSDRDSDYLLELAGQSDFIQGVVAWVDLKDPQAPERIRQLAQHPKMRGLRPMLQDLEDDAWIDDRALAPAVEAMVACNLSFDALVCSRHLRFLQRFARCYPRLTIILDHAAKPPIAAGEREPWATEIAALGALPNIYCKLSGLLTEASPQVLKASPEALQASPEQSLDMSLDPGLEVLQPWVNRLLAVFGSERLLWGSDWPVVNLVSDYPRWLALTEALLSSLNALQKNNIMANTARSVYRLTR